MLFLRKYPAGESKAVQVHIIIFSDGNGSWYLIRHSGTKPVVQCYMVSPIKFRMLAFLTPSDPAPLTLSSLRNSASPLRGEEIRKT